MEILKVRIAEFKINEKQADELQAVINEIRAALKK